VFEDRVRAAMPLAADKILHRIRQTRRGDKLYDARFGVRGRGEGAYAEMIQTMFDATVHRLGLDRRGRSASSDGSMYTEADTEADTEAYTDAEAPTTFRRPAPPTPQLSLS
jgi:hypothetical protein